MARENSHHSHHDAYGHSTVVCLSFSLVSYGLEGMNLLFLKNMLLILKREEGREKERNIDVRAKH